MPRMQKAGFGVGRRQTCRDVLRLRHVRLEKLYDLVLAPKTAEKAAIAPKTAKKEKRNAKAR